MFLYLLLHGTLSYLNLGSSKIVFELSSWRKIWFECWMFNESNQISCFTSHKNKFFYCWPQSVLYSEGTSIFSERCDCDGTDQTLTLPSMFSDLMHTVKCLGQLPRWNFSAACWDELWLTYRKAWHRFPGSSSGGIYLCKEHMHGRAAINIMQYYSKQGLGHSE